MTVVNDCGQYLWSVIGQWLQPASVVTDWSVIVTMAGDSGRWLVSDCGQSLLSVIAASDCSQWL